MLDMGRGRVHNMKIVFDCWFSSALCLCFCVLFVLQEEGLHACAFGGLDF